MASYVFGGIGVIAKLVLESEFCCTSTESAMFATRNRQWRRFITISSVTLNAGTDLGRESRQTEWMASRKRSTFGTKTARYRCPGFPRHESDLEETP